MKKTIISYLQYSAAGLIASAADNLTYFLMNRLGVTDVPALAAARIVSLIVNFILLRFAVFQQGRRRDSFPRYILLVIFSTTIVYFLLKWLKPLIPINPTIVKIGIELAMNFFNYAAARFFVFDDKKSLAEASREA
ncbi:MAG: GtrA family protein [Flexilinea sp.]|nr:GtrA family protein [Flexilinea sp.]